MPRWEKGGRKECITFLHFVIKRRNPDSINVQLGLNRNTVKTNFGLKWGLVHHLWADKANVLMFLKRVGQNVDKVFNTLLSLLFFSVIYLYQIKKILTRSKVCRFCCCMLSVGISKRHFFVFRNIIWYREMSWNTSYQSLCGREVHECKKTPTVSPPASKLCFSCNQ